MSHILSYSVAYSTLFRQRVNTLPLQPPLSTYDPQKLTTHLSTDHPVSAVILSSALMGSMVVQGQVTRGFNSDKVKGGYMKDFAPTTPIKSLNYPTIGAAWNYFDNKITSFYYIAGNTPLKEISPTGKPLVVLQYTASFPSVNLSPLNSVEYGKPGQVYRVVQPVQFNTNGVINVSPLLGQGFTQTKPNVFEAELKNVPNLGELSINIYSSTFTMVREYTLSGDMFTATEPGFFKESEFSANPVISQINNHIQTYPHYGIKDNELSDNACLSSDWLQNIYSDYRQQTGYGGDTWFVEGINNSHPIEPVTTGTLVYWIALYNGQETGKRVRHPDGSIIAKPVNGKKRIRCAFALAAELTPLADPGVVLRRCNPTVGYKRGLT